MREIAGADLVPLMILLQPSSKFELTVRAPHALAQMQQEAGKSGRSGTGHSATGGAAGGGVESAVRRLETDHGLGAEASVSASFRSQVKTLARFDAQTVPKPALVAFVDSQSQLEEEDADDASAFAAG